MKTKSENISVFVQVEGTGTMRRVGEDRLYKFSGEFVAENIDDLTIEARRDFLLELSKVTELYVIVLTVEQMKGKRR